MSSKLKSLFIVVWVSFNSALHFREWEEEGKQQAKRAGHWRGRKKKSFCFHFSFNFSRLQARKKLLAKLLLSSLRIDHVANFAKRSRVSFFARNSFYVRNSWILFLSVVSFIVTRNEIEILIKAWKFRFIHNQIRKDTKKSLLFAVFLKFKE